MHWMVEEADLNQDVIDWNNKLTVGERNLLAKLFRFFTQGDMLVMDAYADKYIPVIGKQPEVKRMMLAFANAETIHIEAYSKLIETIGMPDTEFSAFLEHGEMVAKMDYVMKFDPTQYVLEPSGHFAELIEAAREFKYELARSLAAYSAFMEGMQLFSSFAVLMNFNRFNKMKGMGKVIEWSVRDELLHCEGMCWLFREFIKENPEIWTDEFKKEIYQICRDMVKLEDKFIDLMFKEAGEIEGLTPEELKKYIRFIADRRLADLGLKANYHVKENPLSFMDWMLMDSHTNFFEQKVTEYSKGGDNDWSFLD
jgi:ribonucleoside-diphosphate reductase beta chain